jgi:hypothetical protein
MKSLKKPQIKHLYDNGTSTKPIYTERAYQHNHYLFS